MALVKCPECGKNGVSDSAIACPQCGFNIKEYYENVKINEEPEEIYIDDEDLYKSDSNFSTPPRSFNFGGQPLTWTKLAENNWVRAIVAIVAFLFLFHAFTSGSNSGGDYHRKECEWCGKVEDTKTYRVKTIDGYNKDGSFKYKYITVELSDKCLAKAKEDGVKYGWLTYTES